MQSKTFFTPGRMVGLAILIAITVVLQVFASHIITFGGVAITLALVPIVVGGAVYGPLAGAVIGLAFSTVVFITAVSGMEPGGAFLWGINPVMTTLVIFLRGGMAGLSAGATYTAVSKIDKPLGVIAAAAVAPIVNTGLFLAAMFLFFRETLIVWAGDTNVLHFLFIGLAGVNFLIELGINMALSPAIVRILRVVKQPRGA